MRIEDIAQLCKFVAITGPKQILSGVLCRISLSREGTTRFKDSPRVSHACSRAPLVRVLTRVHVHRLAARAHDLRSRDTERDVRRMCRSPRGPDLGMLFVFAVSHRSSSIVGMTAETATGRSLLQLQWRDPCLRNQGLRCAKGIEEGRYFPTQGRLKKKNCSAI